MKDQPSPLLKAAIAEMEAIAERYDIAAHIILVSKDHGEYLFHFPKWSKAQLENLASGGFGIRIKAKGKDEDKTIGSTVHMIQVFQEVSENLSNSMVSILKMLSEKVIIEGGPKRL
jgi:hypothetical protein